MVVLPALSKENVEAGNELDQSDSIDVEKGPDESQTIHRSDTVRFGRSASGLDMQGHRRVMSSAGIGMHRTLSLERPRFEQKNKVIGDFRTLSIQLSQDGIAAAGTHKSKKSRQKGLREIADLDWHKLSAEETLSRLGSSRTAGLDAEQAKRRLDSDGPNVISKPPNRWLRKLFTYIFGGFGSLLTGAGVICFIAWRIGQPSECSVARLPFCRP